MATPPENIINTSQFEFWNSDASQGWIRNQTYMDQVTTGVTDRLFQLAAIRPGERIIDIGCGTGTTALSAARATGPTGAVLGIDLSQPMLDHARDRARASENGAVLELLNADAQNHRFEAASYDLLQSKFGVMFFADPVVAFSNLRRALRPGGRLCFVCWGPGAENPWFAIPRAAASQYLTPPDQVPPRAPGPMAFAETDYIAKILESAGFQEVSAETESCHFQAGLDAAATAAHALTMGPAGRMIRQQQPPKETVAAIGTAMAQAFAQYQGQDGVVVPARLNFVRARQP